MQAQDESILYGNTLEQLNKKRGADDLSDFVGEFIFPIVDGIVNNQEMAGQITGMLIDQEEAILVKMLATPESLREHINESIAELGNK